jgi:hypothetical protein
MRASRDVVTWTNPHVLSSLVGLGVSFRRLRLTPPWLAGVEVGEQCFGKCPTWHRYRVGFKVTWIFLKGFPFTLPNWMSDGGSSHRIVCVETVPSHVPEP